MADVALQFVVEILVPIIKETWKYIDGAKEDSTQQLLGELNRLKAFLKDVAKYRLSNSEQWKHFVKEVQVMVYKVEGLIDKLIVEAKLHQEKNKFMKIIDKPKYHKTVWDLSQGIKAALEQVKKIIPWLSRQSQLLIVSRKLLPLAHRILCWKKMKLSALTRKQN